MCWNFTVSTITTSVGFLSNTLGIFLINDPFYTCYAILFYFLLWMELGEALGWGAYESRGNSASRWNKSQMRFATMLCLMANLGQPLMAVLALLPFSSAHDILKWSAVIVAGIYSWYTCWAASNQMDRYVSISKDMQSDYKSEPKVCMKEDSWLKHTGYIGMEIEWYMNKAMTALFGESDQDCHSHVVFPWWKQVSPVMYLFALFFTIVTLVRPLSFMVYSFSSIGLTLLISLIFFKNGETGSLWCWFTSLLCVINPIAYYYLVKKKGKGMKWSDVENIA